MRKRSVSHTRTSLYHPMTNGMLERFHRSLKSALRILQSERQLPETAIRNMLVTFRSTAQPLMGYLLRR